MPMVSQVHLTESVPMINTGGDLMSAHVLTIESTNGDQHIFSIGSLDLMRLYFLINKVVYID